MSDTILEIRHLSKSFGANAVLRDIDFSVNKGDVICVIGASGSGKSTLLRCINMLETPSGGEILFHGKDITKERVNVPAYRAKVGMVFQSFNLFANMTALQNCMIGMTKVQKKDRKTAEKTARYYLDKVGMSPYIHAKPRQLSGGQKQRVAIARALATSPKVLLCDEATSALDPTTTQSILALLKELNQKLGVTVVVITHEMRVIEQICSRVAIIADSRIVEIGAVEEVFRHPKTEAAKKLLFPRGENTAAFTGKGKFFRVTFEGASAEDPVIADMVLRFGEPVNIVFADTKNIDGKMFGHMILQFPEEPATVERMLAYLESENVGYAEEEYHV
jgi:D-methionine transport system ATP-binding protein